MLITKKITPDLTAFRAQCCTLLSNNGRCRLPLSPGALSNSEWPSDDAFSYQGNGDDRHLAFLGVTVTVRQAGITFGAILWIPENKESDSCYDVVVVLNKQPWARRRRCSSCQDRAEYGRTGLRTKPSQAKCPAKFVSLGWSYRPALSGMVILRTALLIFRLLHVTGRTSYLLLY